eukprot:TRINITY_DN10414_c0_g1_i1.p1 TRINITY_DN10414_c0_g1~~TRINITY_DN10414_c0_g1_i1.p1  ORF type:complete len:551 (-),score=143.38 TRINITY_DN10414_c0_g1_i1:229-1881(-)
MKTIGILFVALYILSVQSLNAPTFFLPSWPEEPDFKPPFDNVAQQWTYTFLQLYREGQSTVPPNRITAFGPGARISVVFTACMHDALVSITGEGKALSGVEVPGNIDNKKSNQDAAVSYAAYTAFVGLFSTLNPNWVTYGQQQLQDLGYSLPTGTPSRWTAAGRGIMACQNVLDYYANDGTNEAGQFPGYPVPYSDYSQYVPPNDAMTTFAKSSCSLRAGIDAWQPARQKFTTLAWGDAYFGAYRKPFALTSNIQFSRLVGPSRYISPNNATQAQFVAKTNNMVTASASLDDNTKAIATYWNDGEGYNAAISLRFGVSALKAKRIKNIQSTVRLLVGLSYSYLDATITQYDGKRFWGSARPTTAVQCLLAGQTITAWKGAYQGVGTMNAGDWRAYLVDSVVQIPTPEYQCGHCIGSAATYRFMKLFFNNDTFAGYARTLKAGTFGVEPAITNSSAPGFINGVTNVPNSGPGTVGYAPASDITLGWTSWDGLGDQAGQSRVLLGVHFDESYLISRDYGRQIGGQVYDKLRQQYWGGSGGNAFEWLLDLLDN